MALKNLWGGLSTLSPTILTPTEILKKQAALLSDMTNGILQADVTVTVSTFTGEFTLEMDIVAPAIDNYRYSVLRASHGIELFPVKVSPAWDSIEVTECNDEAEFEAALEQILSSEKITRIINLLRAQSHAM